MADIYRKSLLDKMSSPEQLDKMVVITPPSFWVALLGGLIIVAVALAWSIFGTLPDKVEAKGIYVPEQGSYIISSEVTGIIKDVSVNVGDEVEEGDELFSVDVSSLQKEREKLEKRRDIVDKITIDSDEETDVANSDTQNLLNIKTQLKSTDANPQYEAYIISLGKYNEALLLAEQAKNAAAEAQSAYAQAAAKIDQAYSTGIDHKTQELSDAINRLQTLISYYDAKSASQANYDAAVAAYDAAVAAGVTGEELALYQQAVDLALAELNGNSALVIAAEAACSSLDLAGMSASDKPKAVDALTSVSGKYNTHVAGAAADEKYSGNANLAALKSQYETAAQEYANANNIAASYRSSVDSYEVSSNSQASSAAVQAKGYVEQFEAAKGAALDKFDAEIDKYSKQIEDSVVRSTMPGKISNISVVKGSAIQQGTQAVIIRQVADSENVICYVPVGNGKKVTPGMKVNIYPSTVDRQEYGHINGVVAEVSEYVATQSEMFDKVGDESLVNLFRQDGPVVEVQCMLIPDDTTQSGYEWSNKKGSEVRLTAGTMVSADIITEEKQPISLLIPYLKNWFENLTEG